MLNYMYRNHDIYAVDVHLGCCNYDGLNEVMGYVNDNKDSLMQFCSLVLDGESNCFTRNKTSKFCRLALHTTMFVFQTQTL